MEYLDFLRDLFDQIYKEIHASFVVRGWPGGMWSVSKYLLILLLVAGIPALLIAYFRRVLKKRSRRLRLLQRNHLDLEQLKSYEGDLYSEIEHIAEELASHPSNPQTIKFPDGHFEIAREEMGGLAHRLFDQILEESRNVNASEIHVTRTLTETVVKYRVSGLLSDRHTFARHLHPILIAIAKGRARMDIGVRNVAEHGFYVARIPGRERRINVMVYPGTDGPDLILRFTHTIWPSYRLTDMGLTDTQVQTYGELLLPARGFLLMTGPGHSAKTSLAYTTVFQLQEGRRKIIAIEDRPLTTVPGIQQSAIDINHREEANDLFRQIIENRPQVILVDAELPDESMSLVTSALLQRTLIIRVIDTVKVGRLLSRLSRYCEDPSVLTNGLIGIVDCRLIRKICPNCRQPSALSRATSRIFQEEISLQGKDYFRGAGCDQCERTGYTDLTGLFAVVTPTEELKNSIRNQSGVMEMDRIWKEIGEKSLRHNGVAMARQGITTLDELIRVLSPTKEEQLV